MKDLERFIIGFRNFQKDYFGPECSQFEPLKQGQSPKTMIIGCSDSRVDPGKIRNYSSGPLSRPPSSSLWKIYGLSPGSLNVSAPAPFLCTAGTLIWRLGNFWNINRRHGSS